MCFTGAPEAARGGGRRRARDGTGVALGPHGRPRRRSPPYAGARQERRAQCPGGGEGASSATRLCSQLRLLALHHLCLPSHPPPGRFLQRASYRDLSSPYRRRHPAASSSISVGLPRRPGRRHTHRHGGPGAAPRAPLGHARATQSSVSSTLPRGARAPGTGRAHPHDRLRRAPTAPDAASPLRAAAEASPRRRDGCPPAGDGGTGGVDQGLHP